MTSILIISSTVAISVSFLCSLAEALLLSMNPLSVNRLQATQPRAAESWRRLKKNMARPITAILVLNTCAHTGGAIVAGGAFAEIYGERNVWIFSIFFTIVVLFGTEILPKIIGVTFRNQLAPWAGPILEVVTRLLYPFIVLSEAMFSRLTDHGKPEQITTSDVITLATLARSGKAINVEQECIIVNAVRLTHNAIKTAMIPAEQIRYLAHDATPESFLALMKGSGHTRYPVSKSRDPKDIYAYIATKKVLPTSHGEIVELMTHAKPIRTVDQHATLMTGLQTMLSNKEHLLSVVDEQKKCVGIVTLEDIAGELLSADLEHFK